MDFLECNWSRWGGNQFLKTEAHDEEHQEILLGSRDTRDALFLFLAEVDHQDRNDHNESENRNEFGGDATTSMVTTSRFSTALCSRIGSRVVGGGVWGWLHSQSALVLSF